MYPGPGGNYPTGNYPGYNYNQQDPSQQPAYGQAPPGGAPAYGGQPAYGQPAYGQPAYGQQPGYPGGMPGMPGPPGGMPGGVPAFGQPPQQQYGGGYGAPPAPDMGYNSAPGPLNYGLQPQPGGPQQAPAPFGFAVPQPADANFYGGGGGGGGADPRAAAGYGATPPPDAASYGGGGGGADPATSGAAAAVETAVVQEEAVVSEHRPPPTPVLSPEEQVEMKVVTSRQMASRAPTDPAARALYDAFSQVAGAELQIGHTELREILNHVFRKDFKFDGFSTETIRSMIGLMDYDQSGKLNFDQFSNLWDDLRLWQTVFKKLDYDKNGYFDTDEFRTALQSAGFDLEDDTFKSVVRRYASRKNTILFDDFILCSVRLKTVYDTFQSQKKENDRRAAFSKEEFMQSALYV